MVMSEISLELGKKGEWGKEGRVGGGSCWLIRGKFPIVGREGTAILGPRIDPSV